MVRGRGRAIGVVGGCGQLALTGAAKLAPVSSVVPMDYSGLLWATVYGWLLFETLPPASTWLGAPLIVVAGLVIAWREHRLARARARELATAEGT